MSEVEKVLIKADEARKILGGIGKNKFYELAKRPDFPSVRIGRFLFTDKNRLIDWIGKEIQRKETDNGRKE